MTQRNSVICEILKEWPQESGDVLFSVNMFDLSRNLMYTVAGKYVPKTGKCECHFEPHMKGLKRQDFEGENRTCQHYMNGGCDVLTEKMVTSYKSSK